MIPHRPKRMMSQATHRILQDIREANSRLRQIDAGLAIRPAARERARDGGERPLYVGPTIEAVPENGGWAA